jgi:hypothetical protein
MVVEVAGQAGSAVRRPDVTRRSVWRGRGALVLFSSASLCTPADKTFPPSDKGLLLTVLLYDALRLA